MVQSLEQMVEWQWGEILRLTVTLRAIDAGSAYLLARPDEVEKLRSDLRRLTETLPELEKQLASEKDAPARSVLPL